MKTTASNGVARFTAATPCPVCGGCDHDGRGRGTRCHGYLSSDRKFIFCAREEHAGKAQHDGGSNCYRHTAKGPCPCGEEHAPADPKPARRGGTGEIERVYKYHGPDGRVLFEVVRYKDPKDFRQRRPLGNGRHAWDLKGVEPVLYKLPQLLAADPAEIVWIPEGEKDVENLVSRGLIATCNPMGAGKWRDAYAEPLRGRRVVILPDNDQAGRDHAQQVARSLHGVAASVRVVEIPGLAEKGDVSDYLRSPPPGALYYGLDDWAEEAPEWTPPNKDHAGDGRDAGGFVGSVGTCAQESPDFSGVEPRPIAVDLLPVPALDPRLIPEPFRAWIVDMAERAWVPLEFPAAAALVAAGGLIGRRLAIRPKRRDRWLVVPNLWGCAVGPPGVLKTPSVEEALRPLKRLAADALERHKEAEAEHNERIMVADARKDAAKKKLAQLARDEAGDDELFGLARVARGFQDPPMATPRRYLVNDVTVEKLGELLAENPLGLTLYRDELTGFFKTFDKQGHESDRKFFLECWPGTSGPYQVDRIGRGFVNIPSLCLAVFGTCQPGPLARYLQRSISGEEADGFVPRFQLLVFPDQYAAFKNVDREPDAGARDAAYAVFRHLEQLDLAAAGCQLDADLGIPFIGFADDAQDLFDGWRVALEGRLRSATLSGVMAAHLAKYRSLMPSLALTFHLVESYGRDELTPVTLRAALSAAAWCDLLEAHARRVYQSAADGDPDDAIRLAERIQQSLPNPFTCRIVAQKGWAGLNSVEDVRRAVGVLEDRGWVKTIEVPTTERGGRPSEQIWIHPRLRDEGGVDA